ncbi:MAG: hypothetical protein JXX28_05965 [Deltaproteobacteria bacterium]|nr:hypothetical protein [Deltaproteobacteria bacterium]
MSHQAFPEDPLDLVEPQGLVPPSGGRAPEAAPYPPAARPAAPRLSTASARALALASLGRGHDEVAAAAAAESAPAGGSPEGVGRDASAPAETPTAPVDQETTASEAPPSAPFDSTPSRETAPPHALTSDLPAPEAQRVIQVTDQGAVSTGRPPTPEFQRVIQVSAQPEVEGGAPAPGAPPPAPQHSESDQGRGSARRRQHTVLIPGTSEKAPARISLPQQEARAGLAARAQRPRTAAEVIAEHSAPKRVEVTDAKVAGALASLLPEAELESWTTVRRVPVFQALWRAHRSAALSKGDLLLYVNAATLLDAVPLAERGGLVSAVVTLGIATWAVFLDLERGRVLAASREVDRFIAGVS